MYSDASTMSDLSNGRRQNDKTQENDEEGKDTTDEKEIFQIHQEYLESLGKYCIHELRIEICREVIPKTQKNKVEQKGKKKNQRR